METEPMSTERLKRNMERIEQRMQPAKGKRKLTVIYDDDEPDADALERAAHARGEHVIRIVRTDTPR